MDCGGCDLQISHVEVKTDDIRTEGDKKYAPVIFNWKNIGRADLKIGPSGCEGDCPATKVCSDGELFTCPLSSVKDILSFTLFDSAHKQLYSKVIANPIGHASFTTCNAPYSADGTLAALKVGCEESFLSHLPEDKRVDITGGQQLYGDRLSSFLSQGAHAVWEYLSGYPV